jgi:hypothetical protein
MTATPATKLSVVAIAVVGAVGVLDAVIGEVWDLVVLFGIVVAIALALLVSMNWRRRPVMLRADHARWLIQRSQLTGEAVEHIADRAIATYRDALIPPDDEDGAVVPASRRARP